MRAATSAAAPVDMKPCSEAPIPATDPTGSIAMAPKFDAAREKAAMVTPCSATKVHMPSRPSAATTKCNPATPMNASSALWEMSRIPNRSTRRELQ